MPRRTKRLLVVVTGIAFVLFVGGSVSRDEVTEYRMDELVQHEYRLGFVWLDRPPPWSSPPSSTWPIHYNRLHIRRVYLFGLVSDERRYMDVFMPSLRPANPTP